MNGSDYLLAAAMLTLSYRCNEGCIPERHGFDAEISGFLRKKKWRERRRNYCIVRYTVKAPGRQCLCRSQSEIRVFMASLALN